MKFKFLPEDSPQRVRATVSAYYIAELITEVAKNGRVGVKLTAPARINTVNRRGMVDQSPTLMVGDDLFSLTACTVVSEVDLELRLRPVGLAEYAYAVVRDKHLKDLLVFSVDAGATMSFESFVAWTLDRCQPGQTKTNRELIEAVIAAEITKLTKASTASHPDYGSW